MVSQPALPEDGSIQLSDSCRHYAPNARNPPFNFFASVDPHAASSFMEYMMLEFQGNQDVAINSRDDKTMEDEENRNGSDNYAV
jgi:hypothetical protein